MSRIVRSAIVIGLLGFASVPAATQSGSAYDRPFVAPSTFCYRVHNLHPQVWEDTICETNDPSGPWVRVSNAGNGGAVVGGYVLTEVLVGTGRPDGTPQTGISPKQRVVVVAPGSITTTDGWANVGQRNYVYNAKTHRWTGFDGGASVQQSGGGTLAYAGVYTGEDVSGNVCEDQVGADLLAGGTPQNPEQDVACPAQAPGLQ